jgi:CRP/FNR family cyclic AMP-dependent transcriptional regulator
MGLLTRYLGSIDPVQVVGYAASLTVFATFCMTTMLPLRVAALVSNILFAVYGYEDGIYPVLILHLAMFPVNGWRLMQVLRVVSASAEPASPDFDFMVLRPYMRERKLKAGRMLFRLGDRAEEMFYIVSGKLVVVEPGVELGAGEIVGEMGIVTRRRQRTATVIAGTDCTLLSLPAAKVRELFFQYPALTMKLLAVLTDRLLDGASAGGKGSTAAPEATTPTR